MRPFQTAIIVLLATAALAFSVASAQTQPQPGDPPNASLISISAPDENGVVTITGSAGAVFPNATVAIRNLYTEQLAYAQAGFSGAFSAQLYGPGNTPFWISPAESVPANARNLPGSLPGGPGTIVYGAFPTARQTGAPVTQLRVDGSVDDWSAYPQGALTSGFYALRNQTSLYGAVVGEIPAEYGFAQVILTLDGTTFQVTFDPRLLQTATVQRTAPTVADLGALPVAALQAEGTLEFRLPLGALDPQIETAVLNQIRFVDAQQNEIDSSVVAQPLPFTDEVDGIVYPPGGLAWNTDVMRFSVAGPLAQGAATWTARGRINTLTPQPGDTVHLELDVTMNVPDLPESLVGLGMIGEISLQPVIGADGQQAAGGLNSSSGWSNLTTPTGLAIDNLRSDFVLGSAIVAPQRVIRRGSQVLFGMQFALMLPDDLPHGVYVPIFRGWARVGDGEAFAWEDNGLFGTGAGISRVPMTRLPVVLNVGDQQSNRLVWTLLYDHPSDGSRGILSAADQAHGALSNRARFNSPTYILPPGSYPIEPYLLNQLSNAPDTSTAPLLPLLIPGGRLSAVVTGPDGEVHELGTASIVQSWVSTSQQARAFISPGSPLDVFRLTTLNPLFTSYSFDQYGEYTIRLTGSVEDVWGSRYEGGGDYQLVIAEPLDMTPGVLPGTPFETGDVFFPGVHLSPRFPADVTIRLRVVPLDGSAPIEHSFEGQADAQGYFLPEGAPFTFETPGEYVVDYEARFVMPDGRLWAGSLRAAGVIASPSSTVVAHGRRGLYGYYPAGRPAWFNTEQYPPDGATAAPILNIPYQAGDVAWIRDESSDGVYPVMQAQDLGGAYESWLLGTLPGYVSPMGLEMSRLAVEDALPLLSAGGLQSYYSPAFQPAFTVNQAYAYISAVRPAVTVRQFVQGSDDAGLPVAWNANDLYNGQIGVGADGDRPGDFTLVFGGVVLRNAEAGLAETAIYASLVMTTDEDDPLGARVYPPYSGQAGGPHGGPLLMIEDRSIEMFFHPTGILPGHALYSGTRFSLAGQVAPPLASRVSARITAPSGAERVLSGRANAVGYFYDPAQDFTLDEIGVWQVEITVMHDSRTSAGDTQPPFPVGSVLGTVTSFPVYVLPQAAPPLEWDRGGDLDTATRPASPINFTLNIPEGWTNVQAYQTVTMPGYILDSGPLRVAASVASYQYSPAQLNRVFPNLEMDQRAAGITSSDVVTLTFVMTGVDELGLFQARSRSFTLFHDRLVTYEAES